MRMKTQRILAALLSLVLLLALAPAGWAVNFGEACKLTVQPAAADAKHDDPQNTTFVSDINSATNPFVYDLYRVAYAKEVPGYDTYDYTLVAPFAGLNIKADAPTERNAEFWADLAQKAAKIALGLNEGEPQSQPIGASASYVGNAMGTELSIPAYEVSTGKTISAGLYLVITRSNDFAWNKPSDYVVEESGIVSTLAHTDNWDYYYAPQLISIPTKEPITEGDEDVIKTSNPGAWIYDPTAVLKPTAKPRNGILEIRKTLTNYADLSKDGNYFEPMTFTFSVVGKNKAGATVYNKVVALSVKSPVDERVVATLDDIPVGTTVTVTESYSGAHADGKPTTETTVDIKAPYATGEDGTIGTVTSSVAFENVNNNTHRGGHGIENKFVFVKDDKNPEQSKWNWIANGSAQSTASWNEVG